MAHTTRTFTDTDVPPFPPEDDYVRDGRPTTVRLHPAFDPEQCAAAANAEIADGIDATERVHRRIDVLTDLVLELRGELRVMRDAMERLAGILAGEIAEILDEDEGGGGADDGK